jgi:hypothetical protein
MPKITYPMSLKRQCVVLYAIHGKARAVAEILGIDRETVTRWRRQEWFEEQMVYVNERLAERAVTQYRVMVDESNKQLIDRLQHGEIIAVKEGKEIRRPLAASTLVAVNSNADRAARTGDYLATRREVQKSLSELSAEFRDIAKQYKRDIIEGEVQQE